MTRIEVPESPRRSSGLQRVLRTLALLVLAVIVGSCLWTWATLSWAYSDGERAGILQKFQRKGWLCKTYEGEIALYYGGGPYMGPGTSPQLWDFSVRDPAVAAQLAKAVGHRVQLHYTEHPGIPTSCFAETRFFVDRVNDEQDGNQSTPGPAPGVRAPDSTAAGSAAADAPAASATPATRP